MQNLGQHLLRHVLKYLLFAASCLFLALPAFSQSNYSIKPGDSLSVEVLEDPSLNRTLLVLPGGSVNFPFAGTIQVGGKSPLEVQQQITSAIASNFAARPTVFVSVNSVRPDEVTEGFAPPATATIQVFMLGELNSPGPKSIEPGTTFLQAMSLSGGFTNFAATKRLQLRRTGPDGRPAVYTINYRDLSRGSLLSSNVVLLDGDVILVPERRLFE